MPDWGTMVMDDLKIQAELVLETCGGYQAEPGEVLCFSWVLVKKYSSVLAENITRIGIILGRRVRDDGFKFYIILDTDGEQRAYSREQFILSAMNKSGPEIVDNKIVDGILYEIGENGLKNSCQKSFPSTTKCQYCHNNGSRIAFTLQEVKGNENPIYKVNMNEYNALWLHDYAAFAVYLCPRCLEPSVLYNQA